MSAVAKVHNLYFNKVDTYSYILYTRLYMHSLAQMEMMIRCDNKNKKLMKNLLNFHLKNKIQKYLKYIFNINFDLKSSVRKAHISIPSFNVMQPYLIRTNRRPYRMKTRL